MRQPVLAIFLMLLLLAEMAYAREAGWVPLSREPWQPSIQSRVPQKAKKTPPQDPGTTGATVYDKQRPIAEPELADFLVLLPQFRTWARQANEEAHPVINAQGNADFLYSQNAARWVASKGFSPARFFCIMGRMAACVVIIEEGNDMKANRPKDMPQVDPAEIALARRHLGELLTAGNTAVHIK